LSELRVESGRLYAVIAAFRARRFIQERTDAQRSLCSLPFYLVYNVPLDERRNVARCSAVSLTLCSLHWMSLTRPQLTDSDRKFMKKTFQGRVLDLKTPAFSDQSQ
jgi:hypothetical protein